MPAAPSSAVRRGELGAGGEWQSRARRLDRSLLDLQPGQRASAAIGGGPRLWRTGARPSRGFPACSPLVFSPAILSGSLDFLPHCSAEPAGGCRSFAEGASPLPAGATGQALTAARAGLGWLQREALRIASERPEVRRQDLVAQDRVSRDLALRALGGLAGCRLLRRIGLGRATRYVPLSLSFWFTLMSDVAEWIAVLV
jgi:hypothetical protein